MTALIGWFKGVCPLRISGISKIFLDVPRAGVNIGLIAKVANKDSLCLNAAYEGLLNLLASEERLNVDGTGCKDNGRRWFERIAIVVVTSEQQGRSVFDYLSHAIAGHFGASKAPSLVLEPTAAPP